MFWRDVLFYFLNKSRTIPRDSVANRARSRAYKAAYDEILKNVVPDEEITETEVNSLDLTHHMKKKLVGMIEEGMPEDSEITTEMKLMNVPGIGLKKAQELEKAGAQREEDLIRIPDLWNQIPLAAQMFLTYRPLRKIPRKVLQRIEPILRRSAENVAESVHLLGSYRRKLPFSRDADIMIVSRDPSAVAKYIQDLKNEGLSPKVYEEGPDKASMLLEYSKNKYLKADVFRTTPQEQYAMLLYFTGSKDFNVAMRQKAASLGYLLNQKGLYRNGKLVPVASEKEFFDRLGVPFIEPENRTAITFRRTK